MKPTTAFVRSAAFIGCGSVANLLSTLPLSAQSLDGPYSHPAANQRYFIEQPAAAESVQPSASMTALPSAGEAGAPDTDRPEPARPGAVQAQTVGYVANAYTNLSQSERPASSKAIRTVNNPHADSGVPESISLSSVAAPVAAPTVRPVAAEPPRGWAAVGDELIERLARCDTLLRHGAIHSARDEAVLGLRTLTRAIDMRLSRVESETALSAALNALEEQQAFYVVRADQSTRQNITSGHRTPVQASIDPTQTPPLVAAGYYRQWARDQFIAAAAGHPWAADYYYALGRTYEAEAENDPLQASMLREIAACCYQAAVRIRGDHAEAANQLGYVLLRLDRTTEAEAALVAAAGNTTDARAWQNLAELYRRRGDEVASQQAAAQAAKLATAANQGETKVPQVTELTPQQFARYSPNLLDGSAPASVPQPVQTSDSSKATVASNSPAAAGDAVKKKSSPPLQAVGEMFGRILR